MSEKQLLEKKIKNLRDQYAALQREIEKPKNRVRGGFTMIARSHECYLRQLQIENSSAALLFSLLRELMEIGSNSVIIANKTAAKLLGRHERTVQNASKYLQETNFVSITMVNQLKRYEINQQVVFSGSTQQRAGVFSAPIKLKKLPKSHSQSKKIRVVETKD